MAASFQTKSWCVQYSGGGITQDAWNQGFKRLYFVQNVRNKPSHATHVFQCKFDLNSQPMQEQLMKEAENLAYAQALTFNLSSLEDSSVSGTKHHHLIVDWALKVSPNGFILVVKTMDKSVLATLDSKNVARNGSSIDQMVTTVLQENQISDLTTESCQNITHYATLIQSNLTNMQFLLHDLIPRAVSSQGKGGYSLFTKDGSKYYFETLGHTSNVYVALPGSLIYVKEMDTNYEAARLGGLQYTVHGFDPFTKKPYVETVGPDVTPSFGNTGPRLTKSSRYDYVPLQTDDAVKAWVSARQYAARYEAYPMMAQFRGSTDLDIPMQIDFSQTKYRNTCTQTVPVTQIRHLVTVGRLTQTVVFLRDKGLL